MGERRDRRDNGARKRRAGVWARSWRRSLEHEKGSEGISEVTTNMGLGRDELLLQGRAGTGRVSGFGGRAPRGSAEGVALGTWASTGTLGV